MRSARFSLFTYWISLYAFFVSPLHSLPTKIGDVDEDGVATIYDVVELILLLGNGSGVSEDLFPFVDVDGDGLNDIVTGKTVRDASGNPPIGVTSSFFWSAAERPHNIGRVININTIKQFVNIFRFILVLLNI